MSFMLVQKRCSEPKPKVKKLQAWQLISAFLNRQAADMLTGRDGLVDGSAASRAALAWNHPDGLATLKACWAAAPRDLYAVSNCLWTSECLTYRHGDDSLHIKHGGCGDLVNGKLLAHGGRCGLVT